ncbi:paraquat-inducible membrane protein A [Pseudooceanicola sediminis]|uniref:Paraquat-inducible membrane protein A n=1 Tax=Pseudooceanicola sediminis TaxID=2211117 RepID=A0A399IZH1_9RHOB|nr:paraquat-inducible membrane protein A [Puniceibacterium sp. HSS470]RII38420.1 paraquat-inducible membrane protein A [Pseudooceanicola sediminis]
MGLVACQYCTRVWPGETKICGRCGHHIRSRDPVSLQKVWALWTVGMMCYIPANIYPMLATETLVSSQKNTIVGGALELGRHGAWGIAIVILVASVLIPVGKFMAIAALAFGVTSGSRLKPHTRQILHEIVEYVGRWSMIDVFVVAILSSLVQLGSVASIHPGRASLYFALSVFFTMLSAQAFDSRLIWDADAPPEPDGPPVKGFGPVSQITPDTTFDFPFSAGAATLTVASATERRAEPPFSDPQTRKDSPT